MRHMADVILLSVGISVQPLKGLPSAGIVKGGGEEGKIGKDEGENKDEEDGQVREAKKEEEEDEKGMEKRRETKKEQKDGEDTQSYFCTFFARSCRPNFYTSDPV